uniref:ELAV-like protein 2 n=1 Tax=Trichobilharzia regenti TaxID=157069 RepID=A0AA85K3G1_TRIRE|nr:unnamed protein product [Trichobilharzia regenti]
MGKPENTCTNKTEKITSSNSNLSFIGTQSNTSATMTNTKSTVQYNLNKCSPVVNNNQGNISDCRMTNRLQNPTRNTSNKAASGDTGDISSVCEISKSQNYDESLVNQNGRGSGGSISVTPVLSTQSSSSGSVAVNDKTSQSSYSTVSGSVMCNNSQENKTNLIINYLPPNMSQEEVRALFSSVGEVESCKLVREKTSGESLGYAFVKFCNSADAGKAIKTMNGLRLQNKTVKVSLARPSSEAIKGANLYICGLPRKMNQCELEKLFSTCGHIITARILYDTKTGLSRGVAFIRYDQRTEAEIAIRRLNGYLPPGANEPITVKFANSPGSNRAENFSLCYIKSPDGEAGIRYPPNSGPYNTGGLNQVGKIMPGFPVEPSEMNQTRNKKNDHLHNTSVNGSQFNNASTCSVRTVVNRVQTPPVTISRSNGNTNCSTSYKNSCISGNSTGTGSHTQTISNKLSLHITNTSAANNINSSKTSDVGISGSLNKLNNVTRLKCQAAAAAVAAISGGTGAALRCTNNMLGSPLATSFPAGLPTFGMEFMRGIGPSAHALLAPAFAASSGALTATGWCIFVYNLAPDTEESILWQLFGPFGAVQTVKVICDPATGKCKGFGFVTMSNYEEALLAIHSLNGFTLGNRILQVSFKTTPNPKQMRYFTNNFIDRNLLLSNLPGSITPVSNTTFTQNS